LNLWELENAAKVMTSVPAPGRIFVGGISWKADEAALKGFFETFGPVTECKIIMDKTTGNSKGYGFVTFADPEVSETVKSQSNLYFLGKMMNVGDAYRKVDQQQQNQRVQNGGVYPQQRQPSQQPQQPFRGQQYVQPQQQYRQPLYPGEFAAPAGQYGYYDPYAQQYATYQYPAYSGPQYGYPVQPQYNSYYQQQPPGVPQGVVPQAVPQSVPQTQGTWRPVTQQPMVQNGILGDRPQPHGGSPLSSGQ